MKSKYSAEEKFQIVMESVSGNSSSRVESQLWLKEGVSIQGTRR
jgi:transposase-like protein